jgi:hypothetical protein
MLYMVKLHDRRKIDLSWAIGCLLAGLVISFLSKCTAWGFQPFDGRTFQGRIAYSCDGNFNDPDDWAASPMSLALIAAAGLQDRLVHFHFNSIPWASDAIWERRHREAVEEAAARFGFPRERFFDCRCDLEAAIAALASEAEKSTAENPLYLILAGPVEIPWEALRRSSPASYPWIYVISHSRWNEGFRGSGWQRESLPSRGFGGISLGRTKRDLIKLGIRWVQIPDQNPGLSLAPYVPASSLDYPTHSKWAPSPPEAFAGYFWLRDTQDDGLRMLWRWLEISTRPDCSDSGMVYFLLTGDTHATPEKLEAYLRQGPAASPPQIREVIRLEAENFGLLENYEAVLLTTGWSHRLGVRPVLAQGAARLQTVFDEPYTPDLDRYELRLAYGGGSTGSCQITVVQNGQEVGGKVLQTGATELLVVPICLTALSRGDEIRLELEGSLPLIDYLELHRTSASAPAAPGSPAPASLSVAQTPRTVAGGQAEGAPVRRFVATGPLDDPKALPGQVIVAGGRPGYLKINGGPPLFLCGPDNPEDFLFLGKLNPDGTRSGPQMEMIEFLGRSGVNAFHFQMFRMRRCNIKDEGDDTHCPFVDHDPAKGLNAAVLDQWDHWLAELERRGIVVHLEFYNDATDVTRMGWTLDEQGNLHPQERAFIEGIVRRFMHRRNIIWGIEESSNKLPRTAVRHFRKIAELIRSVDVYGHPIVQSLVTPETEEKDIHPDQVGSEDYRDDPNIDVVTWLHIPPFGKDFESQHRAYLKYAWRDRDRFILMRNETEYHAIDRQTARIHNWACALAGMHALEAQLNVARQDRRDRILDAGKVVAFMEQTDWYRMKPASTELAAGSTRWVLASPGQSYILYTYNYKEGMGLRELPAGRYELLWFDAVTGAEERRVVSHSGGTAQWEKPQKFGEEIAIYLRRVADF